MWKSNLMTIVAWTIGTLLAALLLWGPAKIDAAAEAKKPGHVPNPALVVNGVELNVQLSADQAKGNSNEAAIPLEAGPFPELVLIARNGSQSVAQTRWTVR